MKLIRLSPFILICLLAFGAEFASAITPKSNDHGVYFMNLKDGDEVSSPVKVMMGVKGRELAPAGDPRAGTGHHHLIVDGGFIEQGKLVIADDKHIHFGKGQTETELNLTPGEHTLTLQLADGMHQSFGKEWASTVKIKVK